MGEQRANDDGELERCSLRWSAAASLGGAACDDGRGGKHERRDHVKELQSKQSLAAHEV